MRSRFGNWIRSKYFVFSERIEPHRQRIRLLSSLVGAALALTTSNLLQLALDARMSGEVRLLLRGLLWLLAILFLVQMLVIVLEIVFGKRVRLVKPGSKSVEFHARPYSAMPGKPTGLELARLGSLAKDVDDEFAADTFRQDVVRSAIEKGCGVGLQVSDDHGRDIGFFDVYQLTPASLEGWVHGHIFERDMREADFLPIYEPETPAQKHIDLIVGAIMLTHPSQLYNFHVGPLLAASSRAYLSTVFRSFDTVTLYASIYSEPGRRYATLFGFKPYLAANNRGKAAGGHDMYCLKFAPSDPSSLFFSSTRDTTFLLRLEAAPVQLLARTAGTGDAAGSATPATVLTPPAGLPSPLHE